MAPARPLTRLFRAACGTLDRCHRDLHKCARREALELREERRDSEDVGRDARSLRRVVGYPCKKQKSGEHRDRSGFDERGRRGDRPRLSLPATGRAHRGD